MRLKIVKDAISVGYRSIDATQSYFNEEAVNDVYGTLRVMSKLYKEGKTKAIGVSNFHPDRLADFCSISRQGQNCRVWQEKR